MILHYQCNIDDIIDYHLYLAVHDMSMQKRLLLFIAGFWATIALIIVLYFRTPQAILIGIIGAVLYAMILPKVYWAIVLRRITMTTKKFPVIYPEVTLTLSKQIILSENQKTTTLSFSDLTHIGWTKQSCFLFYTLSDHKQVAIIPLRAVSDLEVFASYLSQGA
jgi:hypothetical protein